MQATASSGLWEFFTFWLFTGSSLLGLPPGDRDPGLLKSVPPQTLVYFEWASRSPGKPGAAGVDGFVADPEIRQFFELFEAALAKQQINTADESLQELRSEVPQLAKLLAAHSGCLFAGFEPASPNKPGLPGPLGALLSALTGIHGGLILNGGDDADAIWKNLIQSLKSVPEFVFNEASLTQSIPVSLPGYQLVMHREGSRIIFALGNNTLPRILDGLAGKLPGLDTNPRFRQALERVAVPRVASLAWVDGQGILAGVTSAMNPLVAGLVRPMLTIVGIDALNQVVQTSGIENDVMIQRTFVATGGRTDGALVLAAGQPIQAQHFAHIPADVDLVLATSVNLTKVYQEARRLLAVSTSQQFSVRLFDEAVKQLEKELELNIVNDVLPAFGDVITAFDSPSAGGMIATSLVVCLEVRDAPKATVVFHQLLKLVEQSVSSDHGESGDSESVTLQHRQFLDHTIYYLNSVGASYGIKVSATPTFCLTDRHLMFAIHPQAMKAQLRSLRTPGPRFDQLAGQKFAIPNGDVLSYAYLNGPRANTMAASILPFAGQALLSRLEAAGVSLDTFAIPSAAAIAPYFGDSTAVVVRQKDGLVVETRNAPPVVVTMALISAYKAWSSTSFDYLEEARRRKANGVDQAQLGPVDGQVIPAKAEVKAAAATNAMPSAYGKLAPLFLRALVPNELQQMIPESTLRRLEEGPSPETIQRREDTRKRREDRRQQRLRPTP